MNPSAPRLQVLLTGDELMSGDTVDSNSSTIARELSPLGLTPVRRVTLGDDRRALILEIQQLTTGGGALLINGGLGPTSDDLTAEVLAEAAGVPLVENPAALEHLQRWCKQRGLVLNQANRKQALIPDGAELIANPVGSALGFVLEVEGCLVLCTPGVPGELRAMLPEIKQRLSARFAVTSQRDVMRIQTFGIGESTIQQFIHDEIPDWPEEVTLSFRAGAPQLELKLIIENPEHSELRDRYLARLEDLFGDHVIGRDDSKIAERVIDLAKREGKAITCAESCTGGMVASMITQIPGSSQVFPGGFVTYSNELKARVLGVSEGTLSRFGAVSEETVREMLAGALNLAGADLGVAVSGIAGPDGGTVDKPVGTVWLAWGESGSIRSHCLQWPVERTLFQTMVSAAALDVMRRQLKGLDSTARYFEQRRYRSRL
ncbi:MAG: CinA family nicotinamide mononucleotide deamidase-related protein [Pseudomonadota bacterium]